MTNMYMLGASAAVVLVVVLLFHHLSLRAICRQ